MLDDLQKFRIEFARVSNVVLSHEMRDDDRRAYWLEILEPVWDNLKLSWHMEGGIPRDEWEAVVRSALVGVLTPAQWRSVSWRKKADAKALKFSEKRKESRQHQGILAGAVLRRSQPCDQDRPVHLQD